MGVHTEVHETALRHHTEANGVPISKSTVWLSHASHFNVSVMNLRVIFKQLHVKGLQKVQKWFLKVVKGPHKFAIGLERHMIMAYDFDHFVLFKKCDLGDKPIQSRSWYTQLAQCPKWLKAKAETIICGHIEAMVKADQDRPELIKV